MKNHWTLRIFNEATTETLGMDRRAVRIICSQPGYRPGTNMRIFHTRKGGGSRLFVLIGREWKDASLNDLPPVPAHKPRTNTILISMDGGVIQGVSGIPKGVLIEVRDFDVDGDPGDKHSKLHKNKEGQTYFRQTFGAEACRP